MDRRQGTLFDGWFWYNGGFRRILLVEIREVSVDHSDLLIQFPNKYELVLKVARRAKTLKDEMARMPGSETMKPIPLAINEMLAEGQQAEPQHV